MGSTAEECNTAPPLLAVGENADGPGKGEPGCDMLVRAEASTPSVDENDDERCEDASSPVPGDSGGENEDSDDSVGEEAGEDARDDDESCDPIVDVGGGACSRRMASFIAAAFSCFFLWAGVSTGDAEAFAASNNAFCAASLA